MNDFLLEGPELETSFGLRSEQGQSGRMDHSIGARFNMNDQEHLRFVDVLTQIHLGCAYVLHQYKGMVKMSKFDKDNAEATGLRPIVYYPTDKTSGDIIEGRPPSIFLKLFSRGTGPMEEKTLFTGVDGKPIPWNLLYGVEMKYIPLIHIKRIYVGSKASIQIEVQSAIVTYIRARGSATRQTNTLQRLQQAHPELIDLVSSQLAKLTTDRKIS